MTRVLILGSSHVGALKRADAAFRDQFPDVETDFFAVKAPMLRRGRVEGGVFKPHVHNDEERDLLLRLNGRTEVDLNDYDKTLVVGFRANPLAVTALFEDHAVLGDADNDRPFRVSWGFVRAWLTRMAEDWAADVATRFGEAPSCVFTIAPYPAESLAEREDAAQVVLRFRAFRENPHAEALARIWSGAIERSALSRGFGFLGQPEQTLAGPYATRAEFARQGTDADGAPLEQGDHRHMNADFGLLMLQQFARDHLDQHPAP